MSIKRKENGIEPHVYFKSKRLGLVLSFSQSFIHDLLHLGLSFHEGILELLSV